MSDGIVGILLAAGHSRRFGANKLLQPMPDGTPMVLASARALHGAVPRVLAVIAAGDEDVAALLDEAGIETVVNCRSDAGMGTSIACGVAASREAQGWIIALGDMPFVPASVVAELTVSLQRGADLVAPVYRQRRGHPVGFSARHGAALCRLDADTGARGVLLDNMDSLQLIDADSDGVLRDIDLPQQL